MSCGVGDRCGSDLGDRCGSEPVSLWLWRRLAAVAPIGPLAWEPPYAADVALEKTDIYIYTVFFRFFSVIGYYKILNIVLITLLSPVLLTTFPQSLKNLSYEQDGKN